MANWYKGKAFQFSLKDLEAREDFTIWKAWNKRNEQILDSNGQEIKFPLRDGTLKGSDGELREIKDLKYMKRNDFTRLYEMFSKNTRYIRVILVDGQEYLYGFSMSSNKKLADAIEMIQNMGQDPLQTVYEQTYDANASPVNKYNIKITKATKPITKQPQQSFNGVKIEENKPDPLGVTDKEQELLDATKSISANMEETRFIEIAKANGIKSDRAKILYEKRYKK